MDNTELKFENIYNPMIEKDKTRESNSTFIEATDFFCCYNFCNFIFGCFMFM